FLRVENVAVVVFGKVVWRIENHEVRESRREKVASFVKILVNDAVGYLSCARGAGQAQETRGNLGAFGVTAGQRSIAWRPFLHGDSTTRWARLYRAIAPTEHRPVETFILPLPFSPDLRPPPAARSSATGAPALRRSGRTPSSRSRAPRLWS